MAASAVPRPLLCGRHLSAHGVNVAATSFHSSAGPEMDGELCGGHPSHGKRAMCHELSDPDSTLPGGVGMWGVPVSAQTLGRLWLYRRGLLPRIPCCFSEGQEMLKRLTHSCRQASWEQGLPFLPNMGMNPYEKHTRKARDLSGFHPYRQGCRDHRAGSLRSGGHQAS